jgi:fumarate reductase flavoprotein subunit
LLADGGFQGSDELLRQYVGAGLDRLLLRGIGSSEGDGLRMALGLGAAVANMSWFYGRCLSRDALQRTELSLYPMLDEVVRAGMVVDPSGHRLGDEALGEVVMANSIARSASPRDTWLILDATGWSTAARRGRVPVDPYLARGGGTVLRADTLEELGRLAGLEVSGLLESVREYSRPAHRGADIDSSPARPFGAVSPWYAIPLIASISFTMGGLLVNDRASVMSLNGAPLPGIYATGGTMGGLQGGPRGGYIGGLMEAAVFGLLAAEDVARSRSLPPERRFEPVPAHGSQVATEVRT